MNKRWDDTAARRNLQSVERELWMAEERGKKARRLPRRKEKVMIQLAVAQRSGRSVSWVSDPFSVGRGTHTVFRSDDTIKARACRDPT